jgi:nucleoside phosphorylase
MENPEQSGGRGTENPRLLDEELARDACVAIVFHLLSNTLQARHIDQWDRKRALLLADYARRSKELPPELQSRLDRAVVGSFNAEWGSVDARDFSLPHETNVDVAIITVLPEELKAALDVFKISEQPQGSQPFYETQVSCQGRPENPLDVVITSAPRSLGVHIGAPIARLRNKYSPRAVFLVGTAAGRVGKAQPGDVVIAQRVFYCESGRLSPRGKEPRPQWAEPRNAYGNGLFSYDPDATEFHTRISEFIGSLTPNHRPPGLRDDRRITVHQANTTIATGDIVLRDGKYLEEVSARFDETIRAFDEESYGFADSVRDLEWAVFRGITDLAGRRHDDRWKYPAAGFAAVCLRDFLESRYVPPDVADL